MDNLARKVESASTDPGKPETGVGNVVDIQEARRKRDYAQEKARLEDQHTEIICNDAGRHGEQKSQEAAQRLAKIEDVLGAGNIKSTETIVQKEQKDHEAAATSIQGRHSQISERMKIQDQDSGNELRNFSKRYSPARRSEMAAEILRLRQEHREKKKQTKEENARKQETKSRANEDIETLKKRVEKIEKIISEFEESIREQKSKIWHKITSLFSERKLDDEKMLEIAQNKFSRIREEIQERYKLLDETQDVILESSGLDNSKAELKKFYDEQSEIKNSLEEERAQRDVGKISREKGLFVIHGLPLEKFFMNNTEVNNQTFEARDMSLEDKIKLMMSFEPTISASAVRADQPLDSSKAMYPFGVILNGGQVLAAHNEDALTLATGLYSRKTKRNLPEEFRMGSTIQKNITENLDKAMNNSTYNELVIEDPQIAGFFVNLDDSKVVQQQLDQIQKISQQFNMPVFGLQGGKQIELFGAAGAVKDFSPGEILDSGRVISNEEKLALSKDIIENAPFQIDPGQKRYFDQFSLGRACYQKLIGKSSEDICLSSGEKLELKSLGKRIGKISENSFEGALEAIKQNISVLVQGCERGIKFAIAEAEEGLNDPHIRRTTAELQKVLEKEKIKLGEFQKDPFSAVRRELSLRNNYGARTKEIMIGEQAFFAYGMAEEAKRSDDKNNYQEVMKIVDEMGFGQYCKQIADGRLGEGGKFKIREDEIPIEMRKRIAELENESRLESVVTEAA